MKYLKQLVWSVVVLSATVLFAFDGNSKFPGYGIVDRRWSADINSFVWRLKHDKSGAEVVWIENKDANKTFGVAFTTLPADDTGVAHIIEHSVLCGSAKFPVKEPFVELLKSSLATYINASTGPDYTIYPVCSRNERDLLNLAEVYLDSVFCPLSITNDWALPQEKSIVLNEMRGVMSSPERQASLALNRLLYPDTTYGKCSGGDPKVIPSLTRENYCAFYRRHYDPSLAKVFLYGDLDPRQFLALADTYLVRGNPALSVPKPQLQKSVSGSIRLEYDAGEIKNRTIMYLGRVFGDWRDRERVQGLELVSMVLTDSSESPLRKALVGAGLCEGVAMYCGSGFQSEVKVILKNITDGKEDECRAAIERVLEEVVEKGPDMEALAAKIDAGEFRDRECDTGMRGLNRLYAALDSWGYGGDPLEALEYSDLYKRLRARLNTRWWSDLVRECWLKNPHRAEVTMIPVKRDVPKATDSDSSKAPEDRPEDIAKLPKLRLADLPLKGNYTDCSASVIEGVKVVRPVVPTNGITYLRLAFSLDGLTDPEFKDTILLANCLGSLATSAHSLVELSRELDSKLGNFYVNCRVNKSGAYLMINVSALDSHLEDILRLVPEIAFETEWNEERIEEERKMYKAGMRNRMLSFGTGFASGAVTRTLSRESALSDDLFGVPQLRHLMSDHRGNFAALAKKVFCRERLVMSVAGGADDVFVKRIIEAFPKRGDFAARAISVTNPKSGVSVGFETPGKGSFTAAAMHLPEGMRRTGAMVVASRILSLDWIWQEVRVKGGAYGGNMYVSRDGIVEFNSWRDPAPAMTLNVFASAGEALLRFVESGESFEKYQVSAVGKTEPSLGISAEADTAFVRYMEGIGVDEMNRLRSEIIATTREELADFAKLLIRLAPEANRAVVGAESLMSDCKLGTIEKNLL